MLFITLLDQINYNWCADRRDDGGYIKGELFMAKNKKVIKPEENKHDKFKRVVTPRVNKAIKAIELVGNQAGAAYAPTKDDIATIITALHDAVDKVDKVYNTKGTAKGSFSLD